MHVAVVISMVRVRRAPRAISVGLAMLAWLALPGRAAAQAPCASAAPAPCVIANTVDVTSGTVWDVGTRTLTIASGKIVTVKDDGVLTIRAAAITLDTNAKIIATGTPGELGGFGGFVKLQATDGAVEMKTGSRIDVSAAIVAGLIGITARGGTIQMQGELRARSTAPAGSGGFASVDGDDGVTIGGLGIDCTGGAEADGGNIELTSQQAITVSELLDASGGDLDGGNVDIDAGTTVTTQGDGILDVHGRSGTGSGGSVLITSGGAVTLNAGITGYGSGGGDDGDGTGADIEITADAGNVTIAALLDLRGGGLDGDGGGLTVTTPGAIDVAAQVLAVAKASGFGLGGVVTLGAGTSVAVGSTIDVRGGIVGGALEAGAGTSATISGTVLASGTTSTVEMSVPVPPRGGVVLVRGCTISVPQGASIVNLGTGAADRGINRLQAGSTMTIGGTLTAGIDNFLEWRSISPTYLGTQTITPPPNAPQNTDLPCCVGCGGSTTTSSTTTTTTTTIAGSTSTTSSTIAASTTSTVVTTTLPSTSTTTTTAPPSSSTTTTTVPTACVDQPLVGYDAVSCRLDTIGTMLTAEPVDALGGKKLATRLVQAVTRARTALDMARAGRKVAPNLRRANKQLRLFGRSVTGALKKGMVPELGTQLTTLASGATTEIGVLRATPP